jgi:raffinose/stachyose/melibiose transport system permease protein
MKHSRQIVQNALKQFVCIVLSLIIILPFLMVVINSFKTKLDASRMNLMLPTKWMFSNYAVVIEKGKMLRGFFNSFLYAGVSTFAAVLLCAMVAFVIARNKTKINQFLYGFVLIGLFVPTNYVTLIRILKWVDLYDTRVGLILIFTASMVPFCVFVIRNFISSIPVEMDEAAVIDGSGPLTLFFRIILPLLKPVMVTSFLLEFMGIWSDFMTPLYLTSSQKKWPISMAVYGFFSQNTASWNLVFACVVLTVLPVVLLYLLGQNYIVEGLTTGAVKE